jgi:hypothetical protein
MNRILSSKTLSIKDHFRIFKTCFIVTNAASLLIFVFLRLLFYNNNIPVMEDLTDILKTLLTGTVIAMVLSSLLLIVEIADYLFTSKKAIVYAPVKYAVLAAFTLIIFLLASCKTKILQGIHKDLNTGITTTYKNMEPEKTLLVMNNEVLNHTDIPLGENFMLINDGVQGLVEKEGKVAIGCRLSIADKQGQKILEEPDLFKDGGVYSKEKARSLKCTISTGNPMKWDEHYDVSVVFWDKNGSGKIENNFSVRMIDIP